MIFAAFCGWHIGKIDSCQASLAEAISTARELNDTHGLAVARTGRFAAEAMEISTHRIFKLAQLLEPFCAIGRAPLPVRQRMVFY